MTINKKKAIPKISLLATERERERDAEKVEGRVEDMVFSADGGDVVFRGGGVVEKEEIE